MTYKEELIKSFAHLRKHMKLMDEDEGIRTIGNAKGFKNGGFVFVFYYRGKYWINLCDRIDGKVGGNDQLTMFDNFDNAFGTLKMLVRKPLRAWLY